MSRTKTYPMIKIKNEYWVKITHNSIKLRALHIDKKKKKVPDPSGHRLDEATANSSIKFISKEFWIDNFKK